MALSQQPAKQAGRHCFKSMMVKQWGKENRAMQKVDPD